MLWVARHQNRHCVLSSFARCNGHHIVIPPTGNYDTILLNWLEHFYGGGTTYDFPLVTLPKQWSSLEVGKGKADLILLTDGLCSIRKKMERDFIEWKEKENCMLRTLIIGADSTEEIDIVSDHVYSMDSMSLDQDAIRDCMSI